jgi:hypothetical protein
VQVDWNLAVRGCQYFLRIPDCTPCSGSVVKYPHSISVNRKQRVQYLLLEVSDATEIVEVLNGSL